MSKVVTVEELVANIDELVEEVRAGETLTVVRDARSAAEVDTFRPVDVPKTGSRLGDFRPTDRPSGLVTGALDLVDEDRREFAASKNILGMDGTSKR